jgi:glutamate---cysteine ligase / carboxylate-amine ligase
MTRTVGVEEEFLLAQSSTPFLAPAGDEVVALAEAGSAGQFEHELKREQAELGTAPHRHLVDLDRDLRIRRAELGAAARERGVRLLASGTSPLDERVSTTADARYQRMTETFGRLARMQLTCGMHVHVAIESPAEGVRVLDRIRGWLPVLTALSANSPYLAGQDTDYASYRTVVWAQWPTAGVAEPFGSVEGYHAARDALIASGAALDDGMIYFDARLSASYPTVEIRVCDVCAEVGDASVIAALVRALVTTAAEDDAPVPHLRSELLKAARWRAARWGVEERLVDVRAARLAPAWEVIDGLVECVGEALRDAGDEAVVADGLARIRARGTGARRQREAYAAGGIGGLVDALAELTLAP